MFNITIPTLAYLEVRYRFSVTDILNTGRMMFVTYKYDSVTACAPMKLLGEQIANPDRNASRMLFVQNASHTEVCKNPRKYNGKSRATVLQAQQEELETIKGWLEMF